MKRRSFLTAILAAGVAPAAVRSGLLMPIRPSIIVPSPLEGLTARVWTPYARDWPAWFWESNGDLVFRVDGVERVRIGGKGLWRPEYTS